MAIGRLALKQSELFGQLSDEQLERVASCAHVERYDAGDWIVRLDDWGYEVQIVTVGAVKVSLQRTDGTLSVWVVVGPGQAIPNSAIFPFTSFLTVAQTLLETEIIAIPVYHFQTMLSDERPISKRVANLMKAWKKGVAAVVTDGQIIFEARIACPYGQRSRLALHADAQGAEIKGNCERQLMCTVAECPIAGKPAHRLARFWPSDKTTAPGAGVRRAERW